MPITVNTWTQVRDAEDWLLRHGWTISYGSDNLLTLKPTGKRTHKCRQSFVTLEELLAYAKGLGEVHDV